jgi:fructokinase
LLARFGAMTIISIGEILWDVFEQSEHLGGAALNFSAHAKLLGHKALFLSGVGNDERGERALARVSELGLSARFIRGVEQLPTGIASVSLDGSGQPHFVIQRPAAYDGLQLDDSDLEALSAYKPDWIYYGTLFQTNPQARNITERVIAANPAARCFYDVNLRPDSYTPELVRDLLLRAQVVKLNEDEVRSVEERLETRHSSLEEFCRNCSRRFDWEAVCVTRGAQGCVLLVRGDYAEVDGYRIQVADTVGAGDAFAAAFLHGLGAGWRAAAIGDFANRVGALVASREGGTPVWTLEECQRMKERRLGVN